MSKPVDQGPCGVCKGGYDEHFDSDGKAKTKHVYSPGDDAVLETPEQKSKRTRLPSSPQGPTLAQAVNAQPNSVGRLTEILLEKKVLNPAEALYVAGMGSKPEARYKIDVTERRHGDGSRG